MMSLLKVTAKFDCDECGALMLAELSPDWKLQPYATVFDVAEDALRGGCGSGLAMCSVQDGKHLCKECTAKADEAYDE